MTFCPSNKPIVGTEFIKVSLFFLNLFSGFFHVGLSPAIKTIKGRFAFLASSSKVGYNGLIASQSGHQ